MYILTRAELLYTLCYEIPCTCSEWFHGKCVGISVKRGKEMKQGNLSKGIYYFTYKTVKK